MKKDLQSNKEKKHPQVSNYELHSFRLTIWLGAIMWYVFKFKIHSFEDIYKPEYEKRNFRTGLIFQLVVLVSLVFIVIVSHQ